MFSVLVLIAVTSAIADCGAENGPAEPAKLAIQRRVFLHFNCNAKDFAEVEKGMRVIQSNCDEKNDLTVFIDLEAVPLIDKTSRPLTERELSRLAACLEGARTKGVKLLLCPFCAKTQRISAEHLRPGVRMTTKEEYEQLTKDADEIIDLRRSRAATTEVP